MTETGTRAAQQAILETQHLCWAVDGAPIVDDISVQVHQGSVVALVGPSGAGKSSFLRLLNRLTEPTSGRVFIEGQDARSLPPRELRRRMGMMMQSPYLFPGTVADNVRYGPRQRGEELAQEVVERLLDQVHLEGMVDRDINNLSVGEAQRVSLARTLANGPQVLLLDEPTSALDADAEKSVETLIVEVIRQRDLTCLIVTHDMAQARRLADRALVICEGKMTEYGPIEEVRYVDPNH